MKAKMWAVYHTKHGKMPRSIHFSKSDAEEYAREDWVIKRVEVTFKTGTAYDIVAHSYKHMDFDPMSKEEEEYYESLPNN